MNPHKCSICHRLFNCDEDCPEKKKDFSCSCDKCLGENLCHTAFVSHKKPKKRKGKLIGGYEIEQRFTD